MPKIASPRSVLQVVPGQRNGTRIDYCVRLGGKDYEVYFACAQVALCNDAEAALSMLALGAMHSDSDLQVATPVSPSFLDNQRELMRVFSGWFPVYRPVRITAERPTKAAVPAGERVGCFFTGGVDSFFTYLRHRDEITDLIFVHGYDVDLDDLPRRASISAMGRAIEAATGVRFIELETNAIRLFRDFGRWGPHAHGYGLGSAARHLAGYLKRVYVPSSFATEYMRPWGTHPLTDPLFSDERLQVVHGETILRVEKLREIAADALAMQHLRVCHERVEGAYNCARCEKCLRTMTLMQGLGVLKRCTTFPDEVPLERVRGLLLDEVTQGLALNNLAFLKACGQDDTALVRAWRDALARPAWRGRVLHRLRKWRSRWQKRLKRTGGGR
jgi:hypothetical protein